MTETFQYFKNTCKTKSQYYGYHFINFNFSCTLVDSLSNNINKSIQILIQSKKYKILSLECYIVATVYFNSFYFAF